MEGLPFGPSFYHIKNQNFWGFTQKAMGHESRHMYKIDFVVWSIAIYKYAMFIVAHIALKMTS
jgi:hypothetical protein